MIGLPRFTLYSFSATVWLEDASALAVFGEHVASARDATCLTIAVLFTLHHRADIDDPVVSKRQLLQTSQLANVAELVVRCIEVFQMLRVLQTVELRDPVTIQPQLGQQLKMVQRGDALNLVVSRTCRAGMAWWRS